MSTSEINCRVCGTKIVSQAINCLKCDTPHHKDCWDYNGGCAIYACKLYKPTQQPQTSEAILAVRSAFIATRRQLIGEAASAMIFLMVFIPRFLLFMLPLYLIAEFVQFIKDVFAA